MPDTLSMDIWTLAAKGDVEGVKAALADDGKAAMQRAPDGGIALHHAAYGGSREILELLLRAGSDPMFRTTNGMTPLHYAAFGGQPGAFQRLLDEGADLHAVDDSLTTMLHGAASSGSMELVERLLGEGIQPDVANCYDERPVHRAAQQDRLAVVRKLLTLSAQQNPIDKYGMTLLHKAAVGGARETAAWLLDRGDDPGTGDLIGDTPLHAAASLGRRPYIDLSIECELSLDAVSKEGRTPLHCAAVGGHLEIVQLLMEQGCHADATDASKRTPLHLASALGRNECVRVLATSTAGSAGEDAHGCTPLDLAAHYGRTAAWRALATAESTSPSPENVRELLSAPVQLGDLVAWYLGHSGWAVRTAQHLFILDYAPGEPEDAESSLLNGRINPEEWSDLTVVAVITHHHTDHFDRRVLDWEHPNLRVIYGWDAPEDLTGFRFEGRMTKRIGNVIVASAPATDAGSAFLIEADGVSFYHAGDHAASQAPPERDFSDSVAWFAEQFAPIQAAFLPVFGCGLPSPATLRAGNAFTIDQLQPEATFPMHIGWTAHFYREFAQWADEMKLRTHVAVAEFPGDRFLLSHGSLAEHGF